MLRRFLRLDPQTITFLNILHLLDIHSSMTFDELSDELWNSGYFISERYLEKDLGKLVEAGLVVQKLDVHYITEKGVKLLGYYPNWKPKRRKVQQTKPVLF